jgi:hypothetical protein
MRVVGGRRRGRGGGGGVYIHICKNKNSKKIEGDYVMLLLPQELVDGTDGMKEGRMEGKTDRTDGC